MVDSAAFARTAGAAPKGRTRARVLPRALLWAGGLLVAAVLVWQALSAGGNPDPLARGSGSGAAALDIGVLVFREGLECILVLAAITASMVGESARHRRPVALGVGAGMIATVATWKVAVGVLGALLGSVSALQLQAATGLLAIVVLLVVMNWFFHKLYWTGWISLHTRRRKALLGGEPAAAGWRARLLWGLVLLGFTSFYREGFEVVLFLQSYRLKLGGGPVLGGVLLGAALTSVVAVLTFVAHHRLPYRKMLVATGVLLGLVLLVMVGEEAQEMQLAGWLPTTQLPGLTSLLPPWTALWLGLSATLETLLAQLLAAGLVLGSYLVVRLELRKDVRSAATALRAGARYPAGSAAAQGAADQPA